MLRVDRRGAQSQRRRNRQRQTPGCARAPRGRGAEARAACRSPGRCSPTRQRDKRAVAPSGRPFRCGDHLDHDSLGRRTTEPHLTTQQLPDQQVGRHDQRDQPALARGALHAGRAEERTCAPPRRGARPGRSRPSRERRGCDPPPPAGAEPRHPEARRSRRCSRTAARTSPTGALVAAGAFRTDRPDPSGDEQIVLRAEMRCL